MATEKRQFTLRMQEDTFLKIKYIAELEHRSIAMQVEYVVLRYIEEYEKQHGPIVLEDL